MSIVFQRGLCDTDRQAKNTYTALEVGEVVAEGEHDGNKVDNGHESVALKVVFVVATQEALSCSGRRSRALWDSLVEGLETGESQGMGLRVG